MLVFVVTVALYLPGAMVTPFSTEDEPLEALVVREMAQSGDWVLPRRNGEEVPAKPPLYHWLALGTAALGGAVDETTTRVPSILCAALTATLVYAAAARSFGPAAGWLAAVALVTSPQWVKWAMRARTDATFVLCSTFTLLFVERWLRRRRGPELVLAAGASALAVLAKGPAGVLFPAILLAIESVRRAIRPRPAVLALAAATFLAVAGSWYGAALVRGGHAFFAKQILAENVFRFLPSEDGGGPSRDHSFLFYLPDLLVGMAPWSVALFAALALAWRERRTPVLTSTCATWIAVVFAVCTLASGKRSNYLLPLYPAAAILIGRALGAEVETGRARLLRWIAAILAAGAALVAVLTACAALGLEPWRAILPLLHPRDRATLPGAIAMLAPSGLAVSAFAAIAAALLAVLAARAAARPLAVAISAVSLAAVAVTSSFVAPAAARSKTLLPFAAQVAATVGENAPLVFFARPRYEVLFDLPRHVPVERGAFAAIPPHTFVLLTQADWQRIADGDRAMARILVASPTAPSERADSRLLLVLLEPSAQTRSTW